MNLQNNPVFTYNNFCFDVYNRKKGFDEPFARVRKKSFDVKKRSQIDISRALSISM